MRYSSGVTDTYAFDYFLERFDTLLTENEVGVLSFSSNFLSYGEKKVYSDKDSASGIP